jgi:hypothetical protein
MTKANTAQQILSALGIPVGGTQKQAHGNKNASATKAGPGRFHAEMKEARQPKQRGADAEFVLHTNAHKNERRAVIARYGRRQFLKLQKQFRAEHKAANDERTDAASTRHYEPLAA